MGRLTRRDKRLLGGMGALMAFGAAAAAFGQTADDGVRAVVSSLTGVAPDSGSAATSGFGPRAEPPAGTSVAERRAAGAPATAPPAVGPAWADPPAAGRSAARGLPPAGRTALLAGRTASGASDTTPPRSAATFPWTWTSPDVPGRPGKGEAAAAGGTGPGSGPFMPPAPPVPTPGPPAPAADDSPAAPAPGGTEITEPAAPEPTGGSLP
jgi:hypothetical protein